MTMKRLTLPLLAALLLLGASTTTLARTSKSHPLKGWNYGFGFHLFEPNGTGEFNFPQADMDFNLKRYDSRPLVDDYFLPSSPYVGLGWDNKQLIGGALSIGYAWDQRLNVQGLVRGFLPKRQEIYYGDYPPPADESVVYQYLKKQQTKWYQWGARFEVNYSPFKPIPIWYFTLGGEYTWFKTQLKYDIYQVNSDAVRSLKKRESYLDDHHAVGLLIGSGLLFRERGRSSVSTIGLTYSLTKYSGDYFDRNGKLWVGGLTLELGFRSKTDRLLKKVSGWFGSDETENEISRLQQALVVQ